MPVPADGEIFFVVDVTSFTKMGFIGTSSFSGETVAIEFDNGDEGIVLNHEMARRLTVKKGSAVSVLVEGNSARSMKMNVASVGKAPRISNSGVYFAVGKEGGAIIRIRKT